MVPMVPVGQSSANHGTKYGSDDHHPKFEIEKSTCLSTLPHEDKPIKDHLAHYFGCIEYCERKAYFRNKNLWQGEMGLEKISAAVAIATQLKRIQVLRKAVDGEKLELKTRKPSQNANNSRTDGPYKVDGESTSLVTHVTTSRENWRQSEEFTSGIEKVRKWRIEAKQKKAAKDPGGSRGSEKFNDLSEALADHISQEEKSDSHHTYRLEKDVNAYIVKFNAEERNGSSGLKLDNFEPSKLDTRIKSQFPDQRIALQYLLDDPNILCKYSRNEDQKGKGNEGMFPKEERPITDVRYIHLPSNNMHWAEKLIARYYDEMSTRFDEEEEPSRKSKARMLLRPQYWRGQHHGAGNNMIQARHMRPICEIVSSEPNKAEEVAKNIVLFMPYLHWETDRKREAVSRMIDQKVDKFRKKQDDDKLTELKKRVAERKDLDRSRIHPSIVTNRSPNLDSHSTVSDGSLSNVHWTGCNSRSRFDEAAFGFTREHKSKLLNDGKYGRLLVKNRLGQFLLDAARLYEAIANHRDKMMIDSFLFGNAPLHPRRTLDQAHFCTLKSTRARDRDQVVYRGTSIDLKTVHRLEQIDKKKGIYPTPGTTEEPNLYWTCNENRKPTVLDPDQNPGQDNKSSPSPVTYVFSGADEKGNMSSMSMDGSAFGDANNKGGALDNSLNRVEPQKSHHHRCEHCLENIRKVSRAVMVDQLWMWILDENTIITCFPRRYGANKRDESGVHFSIRARLKAARENQFRSVYDIALVILDECSNTFFDRTKTSENLPQVMDLFSEAIGNVTYQQTTLFHHLWYWTEKASIMFRTRAYNSDLNGVYMGLLDINPEGKIQREIKDIIEELDIMLHFHRKQCEIVKRFIKNVQRILGPNDGDSERTRTDNRSKLRWFQTSAAELQSDMYDRVQELQNLKNYAESTAHSVTDLLALKQQQASVVQTWQSVQQAEETVKQGRAIMVFTIITITFLPLSFMSSIFGMNNSAFGGNSWSLTEQFRLMFPVSVAIIVPVILLAYSSFMRSIIWSAWKIGTNFAIAKLHIYYAWLSIRDKWASENLSRRTEEKVQALRRGVEQQRRLHMRKQWQREREKEERERERKRKREEREERDEMEAREREKNSQAVV